MRPWSCVNVTKFCPGGSSRLNWIPKYQSPLVSKKDFEAARSWCCLFSVLLEPFKESGFGSQLFVATQPSHWTGQQGRQHTFRCRGEATTTGSSHWGYPTFLLEKPKILEMTQDKMRNLEKELATNFHQHRRSITLNQASRPLRRRVKLEVLQAADASSSSSFWSSWACEFKGSHPWKLT